MSLNVKGWLGLAALAAVMAALIFAAAGTLDYWQGWVFLAVFFGAATVQGIDVLRRDPALARRRLTGGPFAEKEPAQRSIMLAISLGFIGLMVVPGLDHRFGWSSVPLFAVIAGDALIAVGFFIVVLVFRENPFTAATVAIAPDQRVIATGPYAMVRHPQYVGSFLYLLGTPLALGSWWGVGVFAAMVPFLIWRLVDEERVLSAGLPGYAEYCRSVRFRLIPGVY